MSIVGHVPRAILTLCSAFLRRGGVIRCVVSGNCQYSRNLHQGELEVPCKLYFVGNGQELKKIQSYFTRTQTLTYSGKSEVQREQKMIASVGNSIQTQCSSIATSLPSDEEMQDKSAPVPPNTCPLKTEDHSDSDVATLVKREDPCPEVADLQIELLIMGDTLFMKMKD